MPSRPFALSFILIILFSALSFAQDAPATGAAAASPDPMQLLKDAKALMGQNLLEDAEKKLLEAVAIGDSQKLIQIQQLGYGLLGKLYVMRGDRLSAISSYEKAATAFEGNAKTLSIIYMNIADLCFDAGKNADAVKYYEKASENFTAIGDTSKIPYIKNSMALSYSALGEYSKSEEIYNALLADSRAASNATSTIRILINLGDLDRTRSEYSKALGSYNEALAMAEKNTRDEDAAFILNNIALVHQMLADADASEAALKKALDAATRSGSKRALSATYHQLGIVLLYKGDPAAAIENLQKSAEIKQELKDPSLAMTLAEIGRAYYFMGNYKLARKYYNDAISAKPPVDIAITVENNLAMVYKMQGMLDYALTTFRTALDRARGFNLQYQTSFLLNNIGVVLREQGKPEDALKSHEEAIAIDRSTGAKLDELVDINNIALAYLKMGDSAKALEILKPAMETARDLRAYDDFLRTAINMGDVLVEQQSFDEALDYYKEADAFSDKVGSPERRWNALYGACRALDRKGSLDEAVDACKKSIGVIENLRAGIGGGDDDRSSFLSDKVKVYILIIHLLFRAGKFDEALDYLERMKARSLLEIIRQGKGTIDRGMSAEDINKEKQLKAAIALAARDSAKVLADFGPDSAQYRAAKEKLDTAKKQSDSFSEALYKKNPGLAFARGESEPIKTKQLQKLLQKDELIVAYMLGSDTSYAWTVTDSAVKMYDLGTTADKIAFIVDKKLRESIEKGVWQTAQQKAANKLYNIVMAPLAADLEGKKYLGVLPDGRLYEIPFAILTDDEGKYLVDKAAIYTIPSLSVMAEARKKRKSLKNDGRVLAIGNPVFAREDLAPLPGTETELQKISDVFGKNAILYLHDKAIEERIKNYGADFKIIHLATHGLLNNNNPMFSSIAMSRDTERNDDGFLEAREVGNVTLNAELVVMSACESGRGKLREGEGILGLTRSFFSSGVPSIIASLWQVNDQATSFMMQTFYSKFSTMPPAEALREAQIATRENFGDNPNLWAPFIIMGYGVEPPAGWETSN